VYLPHRPFFISDLTTIHIGDHEMTVPFGRFPGVAGLFALSHPNNVVDGRRVFFVVDDPGQLDSWQRGPARRQPHRVGGGDARPRGVVDRMIGAARSERAMEPAR
jgi:hypothetical protein